MFSKFRKGQVWITRDGRYEYEIVSVTLFASSQKEQRPIGGVLRQDDDACLLSYTAEGTFHPVNKHTISGLDLMVLHKDVESHYDRFFRVIKSMKGK